MNNKNNNSITNTPIKENTSANNSPDDQGDKDNNLLYCKDDIKIYLCEGSDKKNIDGILELEQETFGTNGAIDIWNLKPIIKYGAVFVIIRDNEVIGACEWMASFKSNEAYLYGLSVKKICEGLGLASLLLGITLDYLKEKDIKHFSLTVEPENTRAIILYKRFIFYEDGLSQDEYGQGIHRLILKKDI